MSEKIKVIIKRPDEKYGHMAWITNTLKNLQKTVGGYIETLTYWPDTVIIMNEDGKLLDLPRNCYIGAFPYGDILRGTIIVAGVDGDDFCDCPMTMWLWKEYLKRWGND